MSDELKLEVERAAFEAWIKTRPGYPFAGAFANLMWSAWQARASSPAAVPEGALPPLPEPSIVDGPREYWDREKMREAQRAAVEADRAQRLENANCRWPLCESEARQEEIGLQAYRELYSGESASDKSLNAKENTARSHASSASIKSDRAQQGETVACPCPNLEIEHDNDTGGAFCKGNCPSAATKAAAPDAPTDELINLIVAYGAACTCMNVTASRDLMAEIKGKLSGAAPVPDTGIPTAITKELRTLIEWAYDQGARFGDEVTSEVWFYEAEESGAIAKRWPGADMGNPASGRDTGIPTAGEVADGLRVEVRKNRVWIVNGVQSFMLAYEGDDDGGPAGTEFYANMLRKALGIFTPCVKMDISSRAPVSSTPTSGAVEKAPCRNCLDTGIERGVYERRPCAFCAAPQPPEAKAGRDA